MFIEVSGANRSSTSIIAATAVVVVKILTRGTWLSGAMT
jgi:hypothetical protein